MKKEILRERVAEAVKTIIYASKDFNMFLSLLWTSMLEFVDYCVINRIM